MSQRSKKKAPAVRSSAPASPAGEMSGVADSRSPESESRPAGLNDRWTVPGVCIFLAAVIWVVFGQTLGHDFVNYDDSLYVYDNPLVAQGLTLPGIAWAFATSHSAYWHPLTWLSHMLDCQLWGLNAGGHHLTNVVLHAANAVLLFLVLRQMTRALWLSAFVAAMFAIHPLNVESVAWVAQRKNVLSTFFWLLTMWAYTRYAQGVTSDARQVTGPGKTIRAPLMSRVTSHVSLFYWLALVFFALGLMSKPMLVTLPFVLLLLDYWPLRRVASVKLQVSNLRLVVEKLPFLLLAVVSSVVTYLGQKSEGAVISLEQSPLGVRLAKVPVNYVIYLRNTLWPEGLATPYPYPSVYPVFLVVVLCTLLLAGVTLLVLWVARTKPYAAVGWFWFLGTLVPVIGLIQVGNTPVADRFTYVPQIGLYLVVAWAIRDLTVSWRYRRQALGTAVTMVITALMVCAWKQTSYWRNSESLWTHTLACTSDNYIAHNNLGDALLKKGSVDEAIAHFQKALQIKPDYAEAHNNLGDALLQKGSVDEAIAHCQRALQIKPDFAEAHNNLGDALFQKGSVDEAIAHFQKALQIKPDYAEAHNNLGNALFTKGSVDEAIAHYQKALQITPDSMEAHNNLGNALFQKGSVDEAIVHYQKALQIKPGYAKAHNNLGNALFTKGSVDEAIAHFQKALQIKPDYAEAHNNLGNALLKKGSVDEAIAHFQKALQIKPGYAEAHYNLGNALFTKGSVDEAIAHFQKVLQIKPDFAEAHYNLGNALLKKGSVDEAIAHYQKALQIKPHSMEAHNNLGNALLKKGSVDEAIVHYQKALQIGPDNAEVQNNLARVLATCRQASLRNGNKAVELAQRANQLTGDGNPVVLGTLAAAYAEAGRFPEAVETAQRALQLAERQSNTALADAIRSQLKLYQAGLPFHLH